MALHAGRGRGPGHLNRLPQGAGGGGPTPFLGLVANNVGINLASGGATWTMSRQAHVLKDNITQVKFVYASFQTRTTGPKEYGNGAPTIVKVTAQINSGSISSPAIWPVNDGTNTNGVAPAVASTGATTEVGLTTSDWLTISGSVGDILWTRVLQKNANGINYTGVKDTVNGSLLDYDHTGSSTPTDLTGGGAIPDNLPAQVLPFAILAMTKAKSIITLGDSIEFGFDQGTRSNNPTMYNAAGVYPGGVYTPGLPAEIPSINLAAPQATAAEFLSTHAPARQLAIPWAWNVGSEFGVNDMALVDNNSAATTQANIAAIFALASSQAGKFQSTITPLNNGTGWPGPPITGQTVTAQESRLTAFNTAVRALGITGQTGFLEVRSLLETTPGSGLWAAGNSDDGTHPTSTAGDIVRTSGNVAALAFKGT